MPPVAASGRPNQLSWVITVSPPCRARAIARNFAAVSALLVLRAEPSSEGCRAPRNGTSASLYRTTPSPPASNRVGTALPIMRSVAVRRGTAHRALVPMAEQCHGCARIRAAISLLAVRPAQDFGFRDCHVTDYSPARTAVHAARRLNPMLSPMLKIETHGRSTTTTTRRPRFERGDPDAAGSRP